MLANVKWLVRTGTLLILIGFFMPSMLVSCAGLVTQDVSLADLAGGNQFQQGDAALYLIFLGALVAFVASMISLFNQDWERYMPMIEAGGVGISLLVVIGILIRLNSDTAGTGITIEPLFGAGVLAFGYLLAVGGVLMEFMQNTQSAQLYDGHVAVYPEPEPTAEPQPIFVPPNSMTVARLELIGGNFHTSIVQIFGEDFSIGRGKANSLSIPDKKVSRTHARLRFAQGAWFIQDQNSAIGTYVNNQRVQASKINAGDQIKIGDVTFVFRS
jgi:hypothetical protein